MNVVLLSLCLVGADPLAAARDHLNHGRYEEAVEELERAREHGADRIATVLALCRVQCETGEYIAATKLIDEALRAAPNHPDLLARRGELRLFVGDAPGALRDAESAIKQNSDHVVARWVKADALTELGRIDEAADECRWFVRHYNRHHPTDAETLVYVAKGALRHARWKRVSSIFHFVVNDLCREITKADPMDWRANAISGALLLEKYNEEQGVPDLEKALAINPRAVEVHLALAAAAVDERDFETASERIAEALDTNPTSVAALGLAADVAIAAANWDLARQSLEQALAVNPHDQETLARWVGVMLLEGEVSSGELESLLDAVGAGEAATIEATSEVANHFAALLGRNPKPGTFLNRLGITLESQRRYADAERAFRTASKVMPELSEPQVSLALLGMRSGDFRKARPILDAAFKADPFHVRVSNMRKVVDLLESYEEIETEHFVVRFDPASDQVFAELLAEYLEEIYPQISVEFGYEPNDKTVFELFQTARGQSGQQWFSARMVGLPWLQTVGASTGLMVAMASPTKRASYNWATVARHEFVHVVTLQQTDFRIPHWYTEALAVRSEGFPRPEQWNDLLRKRVDEKELRSLDELNAPFIRPRSAADWQFAYCQSLMYAEFIDERFGPESHRKLLDAYTSGLSTNDAIAKVTGLTAEKFDAAYRERLGAIAMELGPSSQTGTPPAAVIETLKRVAAAIRQRQDDEALAVLEDALDLDDPQPQYLELLGMLKLKIRATEEAEELFALGRDRYPHERKWLRLLIAARLQAEDRTELNELLEELASRDPSDALAAKKLAELADESGDAEAVRRWATRALHAAPSDASLHELLAKACEALGDAERAATARRHADLLRGKPESIDVPEK